MRAKLILGLAFLCVACVAVHAANADQIAVTVDENGNGTWNGLPMIGGLAADPTGRITDHQVLVYTLGGNVEPGDIAVFDDTFNGDPGDPTNILSDVITFCDGNKLVFYSLLGGGALADSGLPTIAPEDMPGTVEYDGVAFWTSTSTVDEYGTYTMLGYLLNPGSDVLYTVMSSQVPEPSTLVLASLFGALAMSFGSWRRRKAA